MLSLVRTESAPDDKKPLIQRRHYFHITLGISTDMDQVNRKLIFLLTAKPNGSLIPLCLFFRADILT